MVVEGHVEAKMSPKNQNFFLAPTELLGQLQNKILEGGKQMHSMQKQ